MIVRISGHGQFDLSDSQRAELVELDVHLTRELHAGNEVEFHRLLRQIIDLVESKGTRLADEQIVPSDLIVPPEDVSMTEAQGFFTDEGLLHPVQA